MTLDNKTGPNNEAIIPDSTKFPGCIITKILNCSICSLVTTNTCIHTIYRQQSLWCSDPVAAIMLKIRIDRHRS